VTATFEVRLRPDLSLADLKRTDAGGGAVMRSAHFGNWSPSNLSVAALGLRCVLVNTTMTGRDVTYHPTGLVVGRRFHGGLASPGNALVVLTGVRRPPRLPGIEELFPVGANLAQAHLDALRKAVPPAVVETHEEYLHRRPDLAASLLEACADEAPELWRRRADECRGVVERDGDATAVTWARLAADGVLGFSADRSGWLIPKAVIILTMAVLDAVIHRTSEVYHLSGPSMVHYIGELREVLHRLYRAVAPRLGLPQRLVFHLAPTALMTLGAPETDRAALDRLVDAWLAVEATRGRERPSTSGVPTGHDDVLRRRKRERTRAHAELAWAAAGCPTPFHRTARPTFCSQYDLLLRDTSWYPHPWAVCTPLGTVGRMTRRVQKLREIEE
jgi:hypothetical protein